MVHYVLNHFVNLVLGTDLVQSFKDLRSNG